MVEDTEEKVSIVFISYSHDSSAHKKWVGEVSSKLVENGIDVILDQWDLGFGDDVPKFMEHGVTKADRVLMICTEPYVRKADEGEGGVGYEAMIVTSELVRDLGTSKFIPVIRQRSGKALRPKSVSTRFYVNLSEGEDFDEQFEALLRELHQAPSLTKPPLGKSPFARTPSGEEIPVDSAKQSSIPDISQFKGDALNTYNTALQLAQQGDLVAWKKIIRQATKPIPEHLTEWRKKQDPKRPIMKEDLPEIVLEGISVYAPVFVIALAGVESGRKKFSNQISILDEILNPKNWNYSGLTVLVGFPETVAYIYQALHGGMCLQTDQLSLAINLARSRIERQYDDKALPLYQNYRVIGWPETLGDDCKLAWKFLMELPERWLWLKEVFGDPEEFRVAVSAYYMGLHMLELAGTVASGKEEVILQERFSLDVPICFLEESWDVKRKSYRLLLNDVEQVKSIWRNLKIDDSKIEELWPHWIRHTRQWLRSTRNFGSSGKIVYEGLFKDLA